MNVKFEIISRGSIRIFLNDKVLIAEGELTFKPPVFYVNTSSLKKWTMPVVTEVTEAEKEVIVKAAKQSKADTQIVFD